MSDALAERLLDLHCRLISLYILQDVDCLNWSSEYPFFEGERSSYTIQMWWLYVQGKFMNIKKKFIISPQSVVIILILKELWKICGFRCPQKWQNKFFQVF